MNTSAQPTFSRLERKFCPVCEAVDFYIAGKKRGDRLPEDFSIARCCSCASAFVLDPIHPKHLGEIYSDIYFTGAGLDDSVNYVENLDRQDWFFEKYDWTIGPELTGLGIKDGSRWLDIGCGLGNVLDWAKARFGALTFGTDVSDFARKTVQSRGHAIIGTTSNDLLSQERFRNYFDVVTSYEVMEHLYEPAEFFRSVAFVLAPGGKFHFTTGLPPRSDIELLRWSYVRPEVHIIFYSRKGIQHLMNRFGLNPVPRNPRRPRQLPKLYKLPPLELSLKGSVRDFLWNSMPGLYSQLRGIHPAGRKA